MKYKVFRFLLLVMACITILSACSDNIIDDRHYAFIGDSEVSRWDLEKHFPSLKTSNYGISGSGIQYLIDSENSMTGKICVILSGTNDVQHFITADDTESYAAEFVDAALALNADRTYILSIMPRNARGDKINLNELIRQVNARIRRIIVRRNDPSLQFIDIYHLVELNGTINPDYTHDGLHLNDDGYFIISQPVLHIIYQDITSARQ